MYMVKINGQRAFCGTCVVSCESYLSNNTRINERLRMKLR